MPRPKRDMKRAWKNEMKRDWRENKYNYNYCGGKYHGYHKGFFAGFWLAGWLFTVGLLKLAFWKAVLAIIIWAYYLGSYAATAWH